MSTKVSLAGTGSVDIEVEDGKSVKDVLEAVAAHLGLENPVQVVKQLAPIVDGKSAQLNDELPTTAGRVSAAPVQTLG
jgi:hypothetical protein